MTKILLASLIGTTFAMAGGDMTSPIENVTEEVTSVEINSPWKQSFSIYGWLPSFGGKLHYSIPGDPDDPSNPDKEGESSIADALDMVFMGSYEVRKDKWSFLADAIYLKMSASQEVSLTIPKTDRTITAGSDQEFTAVLLSGYAGYNMFETSSASLDIIGGVRYLSLALDVSIHTNILTPRSASISPSVESYNGVVGVKGHYNLSENWYVPYLLDIGTGDSDLTWQAEASIGYRFGWGDVLATYRYVHYEREDGILVKEFDMYGPKVGLTFHF